MGLMDSKTIRRVKVLGVREGEQTKVFATHNTTVYSVLVEYMDGHRELDECEAKEMGKYIKYISMD